MRKLILASMALCALGLGAEGLSVKCLPTNQWCWNAPQRPELNFEVNYPEARGANVQLVINLLTDQFQNVATDTFNLPLPSRFTYLPPITEPGFYRVAVSQAGAAGPELLDFNIGYCPDKVISLPDPQPDFDQFWADALAELAAVPGDYQLTEMKERSGKTRQTFMATMRSLGGDTVRAVVNIPRKAGKYPVHIFYNGYGAQPWYIDADANLDWIDVIFWARGQGENKPWNKYGEWGAYGISSPMEYYYRGAYMDQVRCLDFVEQLDKADTRNIFAEGGSQGGAFSFAAAALGGGRLRAIAPYIPFMSDFPDYFQIVEWPGVVIKGAAYNQKISFQQMYRFLSYFDIKNLAKWINCPVLMGAGLQDPVCPNHTNFAGFNNIPTATPHQYVLYRDKEHTVDYDDWNPRVRAFFEANMAK